MSDAQTTDPSQAPGPSDDRDREARIEQLLLTGLDHYFAGHHEQAINVWTRVIFLDRNHDRARAYIERARSAMAERHRELEELLHDGVNAYDAGEIARARDLLTKALERGSDTAHLFLDRLSRVQTSPPVSQATATAATRSATRSPDAAAVQGRTGWIAAGISAIAVATLMLVGGLPIGSWLYDLHGGSPAPAAPAPAAEPLPVVRASETILSRARTLYAGGHLNDALKALDRIDIADPARAEADRLRADIQRDLLATVNPKPAPTGIARRGGLRP
jgi:tetratricopeptide (TPR) repeat protein